MGGLKSVYRRLFRPSSGEAPRAAAVHHAPAAAAVIAPHRLVRAGISTALASAHAKHVPDSTGPHSTRPSPSRWCVCVCVCASLTECRSYVVILCIVRAVAGDGWSALAVVQGDMWVGLIRTALRQETLRAYGGGWVIGCTSVVEGEASERTAWAVAAAGRGWQGG